MKQDDIRGWLALAASLGTLVFVGLQSYNSTELIRANRESYGSVQRPFVSTSIQAAPEPPGYWFFVVRAQNSGGTPTKALRYRGIITANPTDPDEIDDSPSTDKYTGRGSIGPKGEIALRLSQIGLPTTHLAKLANERKNLYVSGVIDYQSQFVGSAAFKTKFCFGIIAGLNSDGSLRVNTEPCRFWNCADDDCNADKAEYEAEKAALNKSR